MSWFKQAMTATVSGFTFVAGFASPAASAPTARRGTEPKGRARAGLTELAEAIYRGDAAAETVLVERYGPALTYILERETHDEALASELREATFWIVLERLRAERPREDEKLAMLVQRSARQLLMMQGLASRHSGERALAVDFTARAEMRRAEEG